MYQQLLYWTVGMAKCCHFRKKVATLKNKKMIIRRDNILSTKIRMYFEKTTYVLLVSCLYVLKQTFFSPYICNMRCGEFLSLASYQWITTLPDYCFTKLEGKKFSSINVECFQFLFSLYNCIIWVRLCFINNSVVRAWNVQ